MRRGWSSAAADKLSNEELALILIKLPLSCLHRCKCVSKRWLSLISDPYFVREYIESHKNTSQHDHFVIHTNPFFDFISLPSPSSCHVGHQIMDFSLNFIPTPGDWDAALRNDFNILTTSNGLLLCNSGRIFYIRNPLTRESLKLPPAPIHTSHRVLGFMCYPDMDPISSNPLHFLPNTDPISSYPLQFIVLAVSAKSRFMDSFDARVFTSKTGKWETHEVVCPPGYRGSQLCWVEHHALVCNNIFHWRSQNHRYIIAYDPINCPNDCKQISFPMHASSLPPTVHHMELSDHGHIRMISTKRSNSIFFDIWELTDYDKGIWNMKYEVKNPDDFTINNTNAFLSQTNSEIVYLIHMSTKKLIVLNMKNGLTEQIIDLPINFGEGGEHGRAMPFVATPWPIPIPQLPVIPKLWYLDIMDRYISQFSS